MIMVYRLRTILLIGILFKGFAMYSQCDCSFNIDTSVPNIIINAGENACIPMGVEYTGEITINGGSLCNYGRVVSGAVILNDGVINNYGFMGIMGHLNLNPNCEINNYNKMEIETLNNSGKINLGQKATITTINLTNNSNGVLRGPETIEEDSTNFGAIFVMDISENMGGHIGNYLCFVDLSYDGKSEYRIDNLDAAGQANIQYPPVAFKLYSGIKGTLENPGIPCPYSLVANGGNTYCQGANVTFNAMLIYMSSSLSRIVDPNSDFSWNTNPAQPTAYYEGAFNSTFNRPSVQNGFALTVSNNYNGCLLISSQVNVSIQSLFANAGLSVFKQPATQTTLGGNPSAYGGTPPYTYAWTPNTAFVSPSTPASANPVVNPSSTTTYQLIVTDASGSCSAASKITVIVETPPHAVLKRSLDAGYYQVVSNNSLYFKYDEEYKGNTVLNYRIYKQDHTSVTAAYACTALTPIYGDNRFTINLSSGCTPALTSGQAYVLEVINEKGEKFYLKFNY